MSYRAHNGVSRPAIVVVPASTARDGGHRGFRSSSRRTAAAFGPLLNARLWGDLPAHGRFALVCPGGMGRRLPLHSWGYRRQIDDLARMPSLVRSLLPWLQGRHAPRSTRSAAAWAATRRCSCWVRYPKLLAGAVAFDSVTNFMRRYSDFGLSPRTRGLQALARLEVGGTPRTNPAGYVLRSPTHWLRQVARAGVPLQLWWSLADQIVVDQVHQSQHFYEQLGG